MNGVLPGQGSRAVRPPDLTGLGKSSESHISPPLMYSSFGMGLFLWVSEVPFPGGPRLVRWGCFLPTNTLKQPVTDVVLRGGPDSSVGESVKNSGCWEMARPHSSFIDFRSLAALSTRSFGYSHALSVCRLIVAPLAATSLVSSVRGGGHRHFHDALQCPFLFLSNPILCFSQRSVSFRLQCVGTVDL